MNRALRTRHMLATDAFERKMAEADGVDAAGDVRMRDGIWIIEGDELILFLDKPNDLWGHTLRFVPKAGGGYDVSLLDESYDSTLGVLVLDDPDEEEAVQVDLVNFSFPISDASYSTLWVDRSLAVRTTDPEGAAPAVGNEVQYGKTTTALGRNLLQDPDDRLSPCFHLGAGGDARLIWVKDASDKLLITWRRAAVDDGESFYFDVQTALFPDGSVEYSYHTAREYDNGTPLLYYDVQEWLDAFVVQGAQADPDDGIEDISDILNLEVLDDPASDMMRIRVTVDGELPPNHPVSHQYWVFVSDPDDETKWSYAFYFYIGPYGRSDVILYQFPEGFDGLAYDYNLGAATTIGAVWELSTSLSDLPRLDPSRIRFRAEVRHGSTPVDDVILESASDGGTAFIRDFSVQSPFSSTIPIVEPFLLPQLSLYGVEQRLLEHTGWDRTRVDGIPIYQNFFTEILFYGVAFSDGGNCGAANIGLCYPDYDPWPTLCHMYRVNAGWWNRDINSVKRLLVLSHEFSHRWLQQVLIDEGSGVPNPVLNPVSAHPAAYVHTEAETQYYGPEDSSVMGGGFWRDDGGGHFSVPDEYTYYSLSSYELYLMGLMAPEEVQDWFYLKNTDPPQPLAYQPEPGSSVTGQRRDVDINMIIDAMGLRDPVYPNTRTDLFVPLVLVVRPGDVPSTEDWDFMMSIRDPWREAYHIQTSYRATVTTVSPREVSPPGSAALRVEKLEDDELRFFFEDPEFSDQVRFNLYEGALGGGFGEWEIHSCAVIPGVSGGDLYLDATPNSSSSAYFLVTMSNVAFEGDAGEDSSGVQRTTSAERCGGW